MKKMYVAAGVATLLVAGTAATTQVASAATTAAAAPQAADTPWTGTWAASPQSSGASFNRQTFREIVHTSIGGDSARIQLSNAFGSAPVTLSDVHLANRTSGSTVDLGSDRTATFGGATSVTIAAGGKAVSDPVAFGVKALSDVAVSFFLPQQASGVTQHQLGEQTNYVATGDVAGNASLPGAQTDGSYSFLANLDVQNTQAQGAVVALGASITDGIASAGDQNRRWPNDLAVRLNQAGRTVGVLNQGISGNALLHDGAGQSAINRFSRDVLQQPGVKWVIFADDPINDVNNNNPPSGAQLIAGAGQMITAAHQAGVKFLCATLSPFKPDAGWTQKGEDSRDAYNAFVRSSGSGCDAVVDFDTAVHDPASPQQWLAKFDNGDHLHPNTDGLQAMANIIDLNLFGTTAPPTTPTTAPTTAPASTVIALRARANGKLVTAEAQGAEALIANRDTVGDWERFDRVAEPGGAVALRAHANGKFVTAGTAALIASAATAGSAQTFQLSTNPDGSVSLKAQANGKYVTAEAAGAQALIANRDAIGGWEEFDLVAG